MSHYSSQPKQPAVRLKPMLPLLLVACTIGPISINIILPSLPGLAASFHTSRETVQFTISAYLVTIAAAQLFLGPIADRIGRRPTLISCALIYTAASALAMFAPTIEVLIAARALQALGATAGMTLARTVISDVSSRTETARMIAYLTATMVIAPMAAPNIGAFLDSRYGWWSIFAFCMAMGLFVAIFGFIQLKETRPANLKAATSREVIARSLSLLRNREFLRYAIVTGASTASYFTFIGGAPHLIIETMQRTPAEFGRWLVLLGVGYAAGNITTGRLGAKVGLLKLAGLGNLFMLMGATLMALLALAGFHSLLALFLPGMLMTFGNGMVMPNTSASAVQVNPSAAGAASGLVGFTQMGFAAISSYFVAWIAGETAVPIALTILAWSAVAVTLLPPRFSPRSG